MAPPTKIQIIIETTASKINKALKKGKRFRFIGEFSLVLKFFLNFLNNFSAFIYIGQEKSGSCHTLAKMMVLVNYQLIAKVVR